MEPSTKRILPLLTLLLVVGCDSDSTPSGTLAASDIAPVLTATQSQNGEVEITAKIYNTSGGTTTLTDGDTFFTSLGTPPDQLMNFTSDLFTTAPTMSDRLKVMQRRTSSEYYSLDYATGMTPPVRAYVAFERGNGEWTGQTWTDIPQDFTILAPAANSSISRSGSLTLSWSDVDNTVPMELDSAMICNNIPYYKTDIAPFTDPGSVVLAAAEYFPAGAPDMTCHAVFTLKRTGPVRYVSSELGLGPGSSIRGVMEHTVEFTSTP